MNYEHKHILDQGVVFWNLWRNNNANVLPDLSGASFDKDQINLREANLSGAKLFHGSFMDIDSVKQLLLMRV